MLLDEKIPLACVHLRQVYLNRLPCSSAKTLLTDLTKIPVGSKPSLVCILINHWGALQSCRHSFFQVMMEPLSTQPNSCYAALSLNLIYSNSFTLPKGGTWAPFHPIDACNNTQHQNKTAP